MGLDISQERISNNTDSSRVYHQGKVSGIRVCVVNFSFSNLTTLDLSLSGAFRCISSINGKISPQKEHFDSAHVKPHKYKIQTRSINLDAARNRYCGTAGY